MKHIIGIVVAVILLAGAATVRAGDGCCSKKDAKTNIEKKAGCGDMFSKLNLTDDQKTKLAALREECDKTGCTQTSHGKFMEGVKSILTPDQLTQWKADCEKARQGASCPYMKSTAKDGGKS